MWYIIFTSLQGKKFFVALPPPRKTPRFESSRLSITPPPAQESICLFLSLLCQLCITCLLKKTPPAPLTSQRGDKHNFVIKFASSIYPPLLPQHFVLPVAITTRVFIATACRQRRRWTNLFRLEGLMRNKNYLKQFLFASGVSCLEGRGSKTPLFFDLQDLKKKLQTEKIVLRLLMTTNKIHRRKKSRGPIWASKDNLQYWNLFIF